MSAAVLTARSASPTSRHWLIGKREDLTWFIGSSLLGYTAFFAMALGVPVLPVLVAWSLLIDGPHVFAMASRSYFDRKARARLGWRLWLVVPLALLGPSMWMVGLQRVFWVLFISWAQYHIAKQHMGFMMLYRVKAKERENLKADKRFILSSLLLPWGLFLYSLTGLRGFGPIVIVVVSIYLVVTVWYLSEQISRLRSSEASLPKLLLLLAVIPLAWIAFLYVSARPEAFAMAAIATNIGHSLQYQRLTWFHNQNRYAHESRSTIGLASLINSKLSIYVGTALVLNLLLAALPHSALHDNQTWVTMLSGVNMVHFYLDSRMWRVRSDPELADALRLT